MLLTNLSVHSKGRRGELAAEAADGTFTDAAQLLAALLLASRTPKLW